MWCCGTCSSPGEPRCGITTWDGGGCGSLKANLRLRSPEQFWAESRNGNHAQAARHQQTVHPFETGGHREPQKKSGGAFPSFQPVLLPGLVLFSPNQPAQCAGHQLAPLSSLHPVARWRRPSPSSAPRAARGKSAPRPWRRGEKTGAARSPDVLVLYLGCSLCGCVQKGYGSK